MPKPSRGPARIDADADLFREAVSFTAAETGFDQRLIEKDYFASLLLAYLDSTDTGLVFKGGTCIAKVHAEFYRLSEDLDFVIPTPVGAGRAERGRRAAGAKQAVADLGRDLAAFRIVAPMRGSNNSSQYLAAVAYRSCVGSDEGTIKIEVGLREPLFEPVVRAPARTLLLDPISGGPLVPPALTRAISLYEAFAEKFVSLRSAALLLPVCSSSSRRRGAPRDKVQGHRRSGLAALTAARGSLSVKAMAMPSVEDSRVGSRTVRLATRRVARRLGGAAVLAALVACAACSHGEITVLEPAAKPPPSALTLTILPGEAAAELGWTAGIPGAEVIIAPSAEPKGWGAGDTATGPPLDTLTTDSAGHVSVPNLPPGWYYVEVRRWLTDSERARLAPGADLVGFMTQKTVERGAVTLSVPGSHRRSIVISEVSSFYQWLGAGSLDSYTLGGYLELANNSDTTVYLDGLVVALFGTDGETVPSTGRCALEEPFDNDPDGVWVYFMDSLPGRGRDYPLAPGAVALIATNAIDHRPLSSVWGLDLSHADFECIGIADADNPAVPNCTGLPIRTNGLWAAPHGMIFSSDLASAIVVALPVDTANLPRRPYDPRFPNTSLSLERIPRDHVLDVVDAFWSHLFTIASLCPHQVNSAFDRQPAPLFWTELPDGDWHDLGAYSIQRKVAFTRPDGRKILQDTRSTEADFYVGLRTPFQLP